MAGIYIHVPFCYRKCSYCDFYSVGKNRLNDEFPGLIIRELQLRKDYLPVEKIDTIYFGGGTPSLLSSNQVDEIILDIRCNFDISINPEITLEVNPDDLSFDLLKGYKKAGVNRVSIGVQSFIDSELEFIGRRHNSSKAIEAVRQIFATGISNVSLDLIYGLPNSTVESWDYNLSKAIELNVQHLSCYHLSYEESTPLTRKLKKGVFNSVDEEVSLKQYELLRKKTQSEGFLHYEISNFAKEGFISRHNSSYWHGVPYLGVGPSAHSFNISTRQWNPSSIDEWINGIKQSRCTYQSETIDETTKFNELMLTRLRTIWGIDLNSIANDFSKKYINHLRAESEKHLKQNNLILEKDSILRIPSEKYFISDAILTDLLYV